MKTCEREIRKERRSGENRWQADLPTAGIFWVLLATTKLGTKSAFWTPEGGPSMHGPDRGLHVQDLSTQFGVCLLQDNRKLDVNKEQKKEIRNNLHGRVEDLKAETWTQQSEVYCDLESC